MDGEALHKEAVTDRAEAPASIALEDAGATPPSLNFGIDDTIRRAIARMTGGASPIAFWTAGFDWAAHMALSPGKRTSLAVDALRVWMQASTAMAPIIQKATSDDDVSEKSSRLRRLEAVYDGYEALLDAAVELPGVSRRHQELLRFGARLFMEPFRPENNAFTNEAVLARTLQEGGGNLRRGWLNWWRDASRGLSPDWALREQKKVEKYNVGENLAVTPGKVVFRNELFELIQYCPQTEKVKAEPILIVPAWIMKYYILDLSAHNSLVRYLVSQGFTVFIMSWRNPGREQSEFSFDDYRTMGVMTALEAVGASLPDRRVHAVGYCLGGTLLSIAAATMAREGDHRLASLTLLAAQTDFRDAGELTMFIDEDQIQWLEASMESQGYLGAEQMASAFQLLRARDLIWSRWRRAYLMGEPDQMFDLLAWNEDATRMPRRMHSEYLRKLFLNNDFVQGRFEVDGKPVAVSDIRAPIFALGTEKDYVAPWRSVYKIHLFADTEVTFVLASGGHNAGVASEPGRPNRHHFVHTKQDSDHYVGPDEWNEIAQSRDGSWWPTWADWLVARSSCEEVAPAINRIDQNTNIVAADGPLPLAPGQYVLEK